MNNLFGRILYGAFFCVVLPLLLIAWAKTNILSADVPPPEIGRLLAAFGVILLVTGMANLWTYGGGLPMNAYPPPRLVTQGAFRFVKHPIYVGFCMACAGFSIASGNATGLYLVTPTVTLCCYALVKGYEQRNLEERLGRSIEASGPVGIGEKFLSLLPLLSVWIAGYEFLVWKGYDQRFIDTVLPFERSLPVVEWMEIPYFLTYGFALIVPMCLSTHEALRKYLSTAWFLVIGVMFLMFVLPFYSSPRSFEPSGWLGEMILWERGMDSPAAAFPSFHVVWAFLSARTLQRERPSMKIVAWTLAVLIAVSCIMTGAHSIIDVLAGALFFFVAESRHTLAAKWHRWSEQLSNSWSEWRIGNFRVISHAGFSGAAGAVAAVILAQFSQDYMMWLSIILASLAGGALWGQWVEGSPSMLRPFGFYGGLLGGMIAMAAIWISTGVPAIYWLGVFSMATPLTQATGRLRCLVQGCCHGGLTEGPGIRYHNPHTRVGKIPELVGRCIYNTQGYSLVSNVLIALVLFRLQWGGASVSVLAGCYFIFTGAFRFIEESLRGEPQTKIIGGLRFYQWIAIVSIVFGAALTTVPCDIPIRFELNLTWPVFATAAVAGFAWAFGMSMDFPESNRRFARLTG